MRLEMKNISLFDNKSKCLILKLETDPHARYAALSYALSVREENPELADLIEEKTFQFIKEACNNKT